MFSIILQDDLLFNLAHLISKSFDITEVRLSGCWVIFYNGAAWKDSFPLLFQFRYFKYHTKCHDVEKIKNTAQLLLYCAILFMLIGINVPLIKSVTKIKRSQRSFNIQNTTETRKIKTIFNLLFYTFYANWHKCASYKKCG